MTETKLNKIQRPTFLDFKKWPQEWKEISFKSYPRFQQILLPIEKFTLKGISLKTALIKRKSERKFKKNKLSLAEISELLYFSSGIVRIVKQEGEFLNRTRRPYPSAGARYPLEIYLVVNNVSGLKAGLYHYNVKKHALEALLEGNFAKRLARGTGQDWVKEAKLILLISAVFRRTEGKYKDRGLRYIFIEAGHLVQNIYLLAVGLGVSCCSIGGYIDDALNKLLDLNGIDESVVYLVCIG